MGSNVEVSIAVRAWAPDKIARLFHLHIVFVTSHGAVLEGCTCK